MQPAKKKAKEEEKAIAQAEAELAALSVPPVTPPPGQIASTIQSSTSAVEQTSSQLYSQYSATGNPAAYTAARQAGAAGATGEIVGGVMPQAMASYAAQQVEGMSPEEVYAKYGVTKEEILSGRLEGAGAVAAGGEPSKTPGWLLPAAAAGGGLVLALATGVLGLSDHPWSRYGTYLVGDFYGVKRIPPSGIDLLMRIARATNLKVKHKESYKYPGGSETALILLAQSHAIVEFWPEHKYVSFALHTCTPMGWGGMKTVEEILVEELQPRHHWFKELARGVHDLQRNFTVPRN
jgi:S-adenosylmethionine/arginine decarboxylase-like enzyme